MARGGAPRPTLPRGELLLRRVPVDLGEGAGLELDLLVHDLVDLAQQDADSLGLRVQYYVLRATFERDPTFHPRKIFKLAPTSMTEQPEE